MHLRGLRLHNFRCFKDAEFTFPRVTLLTGKNSSGKSTVINSLLTVLQGTPRESFPFHLNLNGDLCTLGGYRDLVHGKSVRSNVGVRLQLGEGPYAPTPDNVTTFDATYDYLRTIRGVLLKQLRVESPKGVISVLRDADDRYNVEFESLANADEEKEAREMLAALYSLPFMVEALKEGQKQEKQAGPLFSRRLAKAGISKLSSIVNPTGVFPHEIFYTRLMGEISSAIADLRRGSAYLGPARLYPTRFYFDRAEREGRIGPKGENIPGLLFRWRKEEREKLQRVVRYLRELELAANISPFQVKSNMLQILVNIGKGGFSLEDVGFGVSQVLPMIVLDVDLGKEGTFLMSQPELHLHPSAQASVAEYIWRRAKELKRQYVIETHSEYLLNRFRLLVANGEMSEEDIAVYYLSLEEDVARAARIQIRRDGQLEGAPKDFFNTYRVDSFALAMSV